MKKCFFSKKNGFSLPENSLFQRKIVYFYDFFSEFAFSVVLDERICIFSGSWASEFAFQWFWDLRICIFSGLGSLKSFGICIFSGLGCGICIFSGHFSLFVRFWHHLDAISSLILSQCQLRAHFLFRNENC